MANTTQQAYDAIKKLEQNNTFPVPIASQTVHVGSLDGKTGKFKFSTPTSTITVKVGKSSTGKLVNNSHSIVSATSAAPPCPGSRVRA